MKINWDVLLKLINKYKNEAEICLETGAYYAALVSIRAALEATLLVRLFLEFFDFPEEMLEECNIKVIDDITIEITKINLKDLIEIIYSSKLITKQGYEAAERIRKWICPHFWTLIMLHFKIFMSSCPLS